MSKDYYNILGVEKGASQADIKKAYRKKAHEFHPDKSNGDEQKFKEVNEAYQVLGNEQKRSNYDRFGSAHEQAGGPGFGGFGGFGNGGVHVDMDDLGDIFGGLGDIFGFGGGRSQTRQRRQSDIRVAVEISFLDAVKGVEKEININKKIKCDHCKGNMAEPGTKIDTCKTCNGSGRVTKVQRTILGNMQVQSVCETCGGEGKSYEKLCSKCSGAGATDGNEKFKIRIPAGIDDGEVIRVSGKGDAGEKGSPTGDLFVVVRVAVDSRWTREGSDIRTAEHISFTQAALGDKIKVETVEGSVNLKIPAGTQSGTVFKLRSKGIPRLRGGGRGDHFVKVVVKTPVNLDRRQKKVLEELGI